MRVAGFRNLSWVELSFREPATLFYGENAQGKTNLLEAICLLGTARSFREKNGAHLVQEGRERAAVEGEVAHSGAVHTLRVELGPDGKSLTRDGRREAVGSYLPRLPLVVLSAEDRALVKGSQRARRDFLDGAAWMARPAYLSEWSAFQRALGQRNRLLREGSGARRGELDAWTETFCSAAAKVRAARAHAAALSDEALSALGESAGFAEALSLAYRPSGAEDLASELRARRAEELDRRCTIAGPQRDAVEIHMDGRPLEVYGSAGQVRAALWMLKLARVRMLQGAGAEPPLFLLDDAEAELDAPRTRALMEMTRGRAQLFMTATRALGPEWGPHDAYRVRAGAVGLTG